MIVCGKGKRSMRPEKRMRVIRLISKMEENPGKAEKLGLRNISYMREDPTKNDKNFFLCERNGRVC
jgi:hypothetical protein